MALQNGTGNGSWNWEQETVPGAVFSLGAVDAVEANAFNMVTVQYVDGAAVDHSHNSPGVVGGTDNSWDEQGCQQQEWCPVRDQCRHKVTTNCHRVARR